MTMLWVDGFEGYATSGGVQQGYDLGVSGVATASSAGRGGGQCFEGRVNKRILSRTELIVGYARNGPNGGDFHMQFDNGQVDWLSIKVDSLNNVVGQQAASSGGPTLFTQAAPMRLDNVWRYWEHKLKIGGGTTGSYELRIDELPVVTLSGIDTRISGSSPATIERVTLGGSGVVDDFYIADTLGATDNDFQGDLRMFAIHPNGSVATLSNWTPKSLPENWQEVKDIQTDNLATYVTTGVVGTKDIYEYDDPNLPAGTVVVCIATMTSAARLSDAGPRQLTAYVRGGVGSATPTVEVAGGLHQLSDTYYMEQFLNATNPATGARWTPAELNAIRAGFALTE